MSWEVSTMKSRTSFFNSGVLKKDILRFAPLWGIYTVLMLLYLFLAIESSGVPAEFAGNADDIMQIMGIVNFCYGGLAALLLFGDLFQSRLCNALHTMPLRREGWFITHLTSGMLFCIVPNTLGAVFASLYLGEYAYLAWLWLGLVVLQYLCFFSIGVLSTQLAGNALGMLTAYGIVNFLSALVAWLLISFYNPVLYGIELELFGDQLLQLSPAIRFAESEYVDIVCQWNETPELTRAVLRDFVKEDWRYLFAAAGTGVLFLGASLLMYRKRNLESAGDFLAVKPVKPVFLLLYTLCVGALFYLVGELGRSAGQYVLLVVGFAVGFFTGWMLLEKRVKIFTRKRFLAFGALVVVFFLTITLTWLDPLGITRYIPETDKVESVTISPYASLTYRDKNCRKLASLEDIETVRAIHSQLLEEKDYEDVDSTLTLIYTLKNGATVTRQYQVDSESAIGKTLRGYYSHMEAVFGTKDVRSLLQNADFIEFNSHFEEFPNIVFTDDHKYMGEGDPKERYGEDYVEIFVTGTIADDSRVQGLLNAIEQDCRAGKMAQMWEYHRGANSIGYLAICTRDGRYATNVTDVQIFEDCENTLNYLKSLVE